MTSWVATSGLLSWRQLNGFLQLTAKTPRSDCSSQDWLIANLRSSSFLGYYVRNHFQLSKAVRLFGRLRRPLDHPRKNREVIMADEPLKLGTNIVAWTPKISYIDDVSDR